MEQVSQIQSEPRGPHPYMVIFGFLGIVFFAALFGFLRHDQDVTAQHAQFLRQHASEHRYTVPVGGTISLAGKQLTYRGLTNPLDDPTVHFGVRAYGVVLDGAYEVQDASRGYNSPGRVNYGGPFNLMAELGVPVSINIIDATDGKVTFTVTSPK